MTTHRTNNNKNHPFPSSLIYQCHNANNTCRARSCCAEDPGTRPTLREVSEKVKAIQETGQKNSGDGAAAAAAAAASLGSTSHSAATASTAAALSQESSIHRAPSDDLLGLFDNVQSSRSINANANGAARNRVVVGGGGGGVGTSGNGPSSRAAGSGAGTAAKSAQDRHRHATPTRRPSPPPPPPYDTAIHSSSPTRPPPLPARPPPYHEALAAQESGPLLPIDGDGGDDGTGKATAGAQSGTGELVDLGEDFSRQLSGAGGAAGGMNHAGHAPAVATAGQEWWAPSSAVKPHLEAARGMNPAGMGPSLGGGGGGGSGRRLNDLGRNTSGSISCTRSTSLAEYGAGLPGVLRAAKGGGVLSSNPRLLCVCNDGTAGALGSSFSAEQDSAGHVSVLDLWHRGRTVRYPVAADRAAMSPNQSESVVAVLGGGSLHVFSIPRRCRLQEQAVATDLCMWR